MSTASAQRETAAEALIGLVVALIAIGFLGYALIRAGDSNAAARGVAISALFDRADGIGVGADVRLAGVKVGAVTAVAVDPQTYKARVSFTFDPQVPLPVDSIARVSSDGLLGGAHVALEPGGAEETLVAGGEITNTQGAIDLLGVLSAFARNSNGQPSSGDTSQ
jgi:phospholipid/cholesterol/gamma-HCH transport system substrate-binding protein